MDEEGLFSAWRAGDRKAGNELFRRVAPLLQRYFANKVDTPHDLEDLMAQTMLGCVQGSERITGLFRPYLFGVARNVLRKHWMRRRTRGTSEIDETSLADLGAGPSTLMRENTEQRIMLEALRRIPLGDQELLEAFYWEGLTGGQLAQLLGVPENTLRTSLRRARGRFERELRRLQSFSPLMSPLPPTPSDLSTWANHVRSTLLGPGDGHDARQSKDELVKDEPQPEQT